MFLGVCPPVLGALPTPDTPSPQSGPPGPPGPGLPPGGRGRGRGQGSWGPPGGEMTFSIPTHKCGLVIGRGEGGATPGTSQILLSAPPNSPLAPKIPPWTPQTSIWTPLILR